MTRGSRRSRAAVRRSLAVLAVTVVSAWLAQPASLGAAAGSIAITYPSDGAVVAGPAVEVVVEVDGVKLVPAGGQVTDTEGHAHILVDRDEPKARDFLPTDDPDVVHFGAPPLHAQPIELDGGQHTLHAVLGDSEHLVLDGQQMQAISITVAPGFRGKGRLTPACADVATGRGEVRLTFPEQGGALQGTVTSNCAYATREGSCSWRDMAYSRVEGSYDAATRAFAGTTSGTTQRLLQSGPRDECGPDRESDRPPSEIGGALDDEEGVVTGSVGRASFDMPNDQSIVLSTALDPILASSEDSDGGGSGRNKIVAFGSFALAALFAAFSVWWVRRGRAAPET